MGKKENMIGGGGGGGGQMHPCPTPIFYDPGYWNVLLKPKGVGTNDTL